MEDDPKKVLRTFLRVVGGILVLIAFLKLRTGFYVSELPFFLVMLIAGGICLYISQKIKIVKPGEDLSGLTLPEKWKCNCGGYNDKSDAFCGNCGNKNPAPPAQ
jgi:hypothetical protein